VSWAKSQKSGLAWPGFGPSQGFWHIFDNFAYFGHEINVNIFKYMPYSVFTLFDSFLVRNCARIMQNCSESRSMKVLVVI